MADQMKKDGTSVGVRGAIRPTLALVLCGVSVVVGFLFGRFFRPELLPGAPATPSKGGYQEGYDAAKAKLESMGVIAAEPESLSELSGTVLEVRADSFVMQVDQSVLNPLVEGLPSEREVTVGRDTVVATRVLRDEDAYKADLKAYEAAFEKASEAGGVERPPIPLQYEDKLLKLDVLLQGDHVIVTADHDVKEARTFVATRVELGFSSKAFVIPPPPEPRPSATTDNKPPAPSTNRERPPLPPVQ